MVSGSSRLVFRFAPSPNGYLHLGHAFSAVTNAEAAAKGAGRLLLRIEDIDKARCRPEFEAAIYEDLAWLGLSWEHPVRRQSEHLPLYRERLAELHRQGLVYPCFCTRGKIGAAVAALKARSGEIWPADPDGAPIYPGTCRDMAPSQAGRQLAAGEKHAWRLRIAEAGRRTGAAGKALSWREHVSGDPDSAWTTVAADPAAWGDVVLGRRDAPSSYHLAVVVDDAAQGVTQVVRGADLRPSTAIHRLLQELLGLPDPFYHHHRLVLDETGRKLSKSIASTSLRELRRGGATPEDIRKRLLQTLSPEPAKNRGVRRERPRQL